MPKSSVFAAEVAVAAERAEAQTPLMSPQATVQAQDLMYQFVGSGVTGFGKDAKAFGDVVRNLLNRQSPQTEVPKSIPRVIVREIKRNMPVVPVSQEEQRLHDVLVPSKGLPKATPSTLEQTIAAEEEFVPTLMPANETPRPDEEAVVLYLPANASTGADELSFLLEGEIAGTAIFGMSPQTLKVVGATALVSGLAVLVVALSGAFSSSGSGGDGTGGTGSGSNGSNGNNDGGSGDGDGNGDDGNGDGEGGGINEEGNPEVPHNPVPEPSLLFLFGFGALGAFGLRRKRF